MAEEDKDVVVKFGANIGDLQSKLKDVGGLFGALTDKFAVLAAVVGGGAAFKSFIDETNKLNSEASKLSRTLGITGAEAGVLNLALGDIGADADTYTGAFLKFNRALRSQGEEMRALGVDVDGLRSGQKTSNEVFQESLQIVARYKPGIDQTQVAMTLFGRSVDDIQKLLKLNNEKMEEARRKAQDLNLTISQEGLAASKKYKEAINDVGDVMSGLKNTVGQAVIPIFAEFAQKLADIGPTLVSGMKSVTASFVSAWNEVSTVISLAWAVISDVLGSAWKLFTSVFSGSETLSAMDVFKNALRLVTASFVAFRLGFEQLILFAKAAWHQLSEASVVGAEVVNKALHGDFQGAAKAWREGYARLKAIAEQDTAAIVASASKGQEDLQNALTGPAGSAASTPAGAPKGGTKEADLAREKALDNARLEFAKTVNDAMLKIELDSLQQGQFLLENDYKNNLVTTKEYYEDKLKLETAGVNASIDAKKREADEAKIQKSQARVESERLAAATKEQKALLEINQLEQQRSFLVEKNSAEYLDAERKRQDALDQIKSKSKLDSASSDVANAKADIEQMKSLREIDAAQAFELQRQQELRSMESTRRFYAEKQLLVRGDAEKQAALDAEKEAAERAHQSKLMEIDRSAVRERAQLSVQAQQSVQNGFGNMINELLSGTVKLKDAVRNFAASVANSFQNLIAQRFAEKLFGAGTAGGGLIDSVTQPIISAVDTIVKKWILGQTTMSAASEAGAATRVATEEAASGQSLVIMAGTAIKGIAISAWETAANVYKSLAAIPFVGPFVAPAAAIAAGAVVLGFAKNIMSAEGGYWQLPGDQLVQAHANEMILPAPAAQGLRDMVSGGGGGGGNLSVNITAMDGRSVRRVLMDNQPALVEALRKADRDRKR